jgi:hypothetical protein
VGSGDPRAVFVAAEERLVRDYASVAAALRAYWRGAVAAANDRCILVTVLAAEFGFPHSFAEREAERAVSSWRFDPSPSHSALAHALEQLGLANDMRPHHFVDPRFVAFDNEGDERTDAAASQVMHGRAG